jgi:hypothetical protein
MSRSIVASQSTFVLFLSLCVAVRPSFTIKRDEGGLSNYGIHAVTVAPYTIAFVACVTGALIGSYRCDATGISRSLSRGLRVYGSLMGAVLVSTYFYSLDSPLRILHVTIGSIALTVTMVWSFWLYRQTMRAAIDRVATAVSVVGYFVAAITIAGGWHLLFIGQAGECVGFAVILIRASLSIDRVRSSSSI